MPKELRRIILSDAEMKLAVRSFLRSQASSNSDYAIQAVNVADDAGPVLECIGKSATTDTTTTIRLDKENLQKILVRFCLENNIAIPRAGRKTVVVNGGSIALQIALDAGDYADDTVVDV